MQCRRFRNYRPYAYVYYYNVREYLKMQTACQRCIRLIRHRDYVIKISRMHLAWSDPVSGDTVGNTCLWLTDMRVTVRELARWFIFFSDFCFFFFAQRYRHTFTLSVCRPTTGSNYAGSKTQLLLTVVDNVGGFEGQEVRERNAIRFEIILLLRAYARVCVCAGGGKHGDEKHKSRVKYVWSHDQIMCVRAVRVLVNNTKIGGTHEIDKSRIRTTKQTNENKTRLNSIHSKRSISI